MDGSSIPLVAKATPPASVSARELIAKPAPGAPVRKGRGAWAALASPLIVVAVWTVLSRSGLFPAEIVVPPETIWSTFTTLWASGELPNHLLNSLGRLFAGYAMGAAIGILLGAVMGASRQAEAFILPSFQVLRQLPTIALIPAFIMLLGVGETVKLVLVAKATALPVALAAFEGVRGIPKTYLDVARIFRINPLTTFTRVIFPATLPMLVQGLRTALARSWMVLVGAELLVADSGLGQLMEWGRQTFRLDIVLMGVVITGIIGFALDKGFRVAERVLTPGGKGKS